MLRCTMLLARLSSGAHWPQACSAARRQAVALQAPLLASRQCAHQQLPAWVARSSTEASTSGTTQAAPAAPKKVFKVRPITKDDVDFAFARSSGPGGQNVNKVNTKVDMRWEVAKAAWVPDDVRDAIQRMEKNKFTKDGFLVVSSTRHRTQAANMEDALQKLQDMIDRAVEALTPKEADPETVKRVQANIKAGNERRLDGKKKDAKKKSERRRRDWD